MTASEAQVRRAVELYAAAWNENDPEALAQILSECWHPQGIILSQTEEIYGRDALFERIKEFRGRRPGDQAYITSGPDIHHGWFRFEAIVRRPDGTEYSEGLDVGEVGNDGLILRVITFHYL